MSSPSEVVEPSEVVCDIATLGIGSPLPQLVLASNQVVDPKCLEQTNIHDRSEKFSPQKIMVKTAILQKVEKFRKFHCI